MSDVDNRLSDGTLSLGVCAGFSEPYAPPGRIVGFINPRTDPERDEDRYYPKKSTEKMSFRGQTIIAVWLFADMVGMVVMAALHTRGWVFPVAAFAPLVAPIFFVSASGYGGE